MEQRYECKKYPSLVKQGVSTAVKPTQLATMNRQEAGKCVTEGRIKTFPMKVEQNAGIERKQLKNQMGAAKECLQKQPTNQTQEHAAMPSFSHSLCLLRDQKAGKWNQVLQEST